MARFSLKQPERGVPGPPRPYQNTEKFDYFFNPRSPRLGSHGAPNGLKGARIHQIGAPSCPDWGLAAPILGYLPHLENQFLEDDFVYILASPFYIIVEEHEMA